MTAYDIDVLLAERRRREATTSFPSLEELATSRDYFGLTTATPVQRAILRVASGTPLGELANDPDVVTAIGGTDAVAAIPNKTPRELMVMSGIRVGKSLIAAILAVYWTQVADVSRLGPGEIPRVSILSVARDNAQVILDHIVGRLNASQKLQKLIVAPPTADSILLRHPSGIPVEIMVVAGARAGSSLVSRWSAGCIADEFSRLASDSEGVINWDDSRKAVLDRILPNCQFLSIGSPFAPSGPGYEAYHKLFGKPSIDAVFFKAPAWMLNPYFWTPEKIAESARDPDVHVTECLAEFASPEEVLFNSVDVDACTRGSPTILEPDARLSYTAAMDPATRGNGWTLVIATRIGNKKIIARCEERRGTKVTPLKPREVMIEYAAILAQYGINTICSDQYLADSIQEIAHELGLHFRQIEWPERVKTKKYQSFKTNLALNHIELPPDRTLRTDLTQVRKRTTNNGVKIILPASADGRHCDYAPAVIMALSEYLEDAEAPALTDAQKQLAIENAFRQARIDAVKTRLARQQALPANVRRLMGRI